RALAEGRRRADVPDEAAASRPMTALDVLSEAVLAVASEVSVARTLEQLAHAARKLVNARYAAIGVPDGEGGFAQFVTSGMSDEQWEAIGELPRQHGLLGAMLETTPSYRTDD